MAIYITGDKHAEMEYMKKSLDYLSKDDILIVVGDFGFIFFNENYVDKWNSYDVEVEKLKEIEDICSKKEVTLLFLDGNHENFSRLYSYEVVEIFGGNAHKISNNIYHLMRGEIFKIEDKTFFVMGGADSIDRKTRIENVTWWSEEIPSILEFENGLKNLDKVDWKVDYVLTHTIFDELIGSLDIYKLDFPNGLNDYLEIIDDNCIFKQWYFGHYHEDKNIHNKYFCMFDETIKIN